MLQNWNYTNTFCSEIVINKNRFVNYLSVCETQTRIIQKRVKKSIYIFRFYPLKAHFIASSSKQTRESMQVKGELDSKKLFIKIYLVYIRQNSICHVKFSPL